MAKKTISDRARFFQRFKKADSGCWEWILALDKDGYGLFSVGSSTDGTASRVRAARYAYQELVGTIPDQHQIDHLCKNRSCVNPDHLEAVTQHENILRSENAQKKSCKYGHPFNEKNTYRGPSGWRTCRECRNIYMRAYNLKGRLKSESATI